MCTSRLLQVVLNTLLPTIMFRWLSAAERAASYQGLLLLCCYTYHTWVDVATPFRVPLLTSRPHSQKYLSPKPPQPGTTW